MKSGNDKEFCIYILLGKNAQAYSDLIELKGGKYIITAPHPAAESYAVKDAAEKIGKIFGKDLNRADQIVYDELAKFPKKDKLEDLDNETNND